MLRLQIKKGHGIKLTLGDREVKIKCYQSNKNGMIDWAIDAERDIVVDRMFPNGETYIERLRLKEKMNKNT